ncbi:MAG TPA: bifunctional proline dehydrogenase/L-glutamate gamma-semialdehyde dehydrogenase [Verrucomicrobiales bacterium]|nr:bifunctional proline dehydrogenase/L-glutamate gamma-semialdehyde dehydrogenase [Verrucomicrobiales bacterium]
MTAPERPQTLPIPGDRDAAIAQKAVALAEELLRRALAASRPEERQKAGQMSGLISDPAAKALTMAMTDRLIRSSDASRAARGWRAVLSRIGFPRGFAPLDRFLLRAGAAASRVLPKVVMKAVRRRLRKDSSGVILAAEEEPLAHYLAERRAAGMRTNVNQLGEAVLGEGEAGHRLDSVLALLAREDVDYISVKLSAIFSQIHTVAWEESLVAAKERLRVLYLAALPKRKMVNLDMEEYRDLELTTAAFCEVLDEPEFRNARAGIVLQAYLPDSYGVLKRLAGWAQARLAAGGSPIKIRLVKGANLAMEAVEAELHGWNAAPYPTKEETDANYRRMMDYACRPEHMAAMRVGVASHNLFDVALALVLREERKLGDAVEIEMLEGMANHQARAVRDTAGSLLLYAPVVHDKDFGAALAYLIRRLDENTSPENFLSGVFSFTPGSPAWKEQERRFLEGWANRHEVSTASRRAQPLGHSVSEFFNEPETDFTQERNREALATKCATANLPELSSVEEIPAVLDAARGAQPAWEALGDSQRADILRQCAAVMSAHRFEIIDLLRREGKKAVLDADAEVSEAVDFARYYAETGVAPQRVNAKALGTVVVTPPWNFPFAIPCGGVLAALMAGNAVILKPAPETVELGWLLANLLWRGGVPRGVLQYVRCEDGAAGQALITDARTSAVVLTGAYETAKLFLGWRPSLRLFAETSGKNSIIVSALADRDLAVKDIVRSAFGHAGQKCSAASLAILEAEVYDDPAFRRQLRDAAASLNTGPARDPASVVTPVIREPGESLQRALTTLDEGEEWLVEPRQPSDDPCLWSPGTKLGVRPGSWFHQTECFGPVLGLMRARDLGEAVDFQNATPYGLTAGMHSLDEAEIETWKDRVQAGNLYVNRAITGAIVQRQPFGGWKRSCIGPGSKAGGPNYVNLFRHIEDAAPFDPAAGVQNYRTEWNAYFSLPHDPSALRCERNAFRYRPCRGVILRLAVPDAAVESAARAAAGICGVPLTVSHGSVESDAAFAARLPQLAASAEFLRTITPPSDEVLRASFAAGLNWIDAPFSANGRVELTRWLREQSVSETRHRYGNLMPA